MTTSPDTFAAGIEAAAKWHEEKLQSLRMENLFDKTTKELKHLRRQQEFHSRAIYEIRAIKREERDVG